MSFPALLREGTEITLLAAPWAPGLVVAFGRWRGAAQPVSPLATGKGPSRAAAIAGCLGEMAENLSIGTAAHAEPVRALAFRGGAMAGDARARDLSRPDDPGSEGCAAHPNPAEARLRALCERWERACLAAWWVGEDTSGDGAAFAAAGVPGGPNGAARRVGPDGAPPRAGQDGPPRRVGPDRAPPCAGRDAMFLRPTPWPLDGAERILRGEDPGRRRTRAWRIGGGAGLPWAVLVLTDDGAGGRIAFGTAADPVPRRALASALAEAMLAEIAWIAPAAHPDRQRAERLQPALARRLAALDDAAPGLSAELLAELPEGLPDRLPGAPPEGPGAGDAAVPGDDALPGDGALPGAGGAALPEAPPVPAEDGMPAERALAEAVAAFGRAGIAGGFADLTHPRLGLPVVRCLLPGLPSARRLGL